MDSTRPKGGREFVLSMETCPAFDHTSETAESVKPKLENSQLPVEDFLAWLIFSNMAASDDRSPETKSQLQHQLDVLLAKSRSPIDMYSMWADFGTYGHLLYRLDRKRDSKLMLQDLLDRSPCPIDPKTHVYVCFTSGNDVSKEVVTQDQFRAFCAKAREHGLRIPWGNRVYEWKQIVFQMIEGSKYPLEFRCALEVDQITRPQSCVIVPWISRPPSHA